MELGILFSNMLRSYPRVQYIVKIPAEELGIIIFRMEASLHSSLVSYINVFQFVEFFHFKIFNKARVPSFSNFKQSRGLLSKFLIKFDVYLFHFNFLTKLEVKLLSFKLFNKVESTPFLSKLLTRSRSCPFLSNFK